MGQTGTRLQAMMRQAVDDGRIITVEAEDRLAGQEAESRRVYKQELCYDCGTPIVTGRSTGGRRTRVPGATGVGGLSADADIHSVRGF